MQFSFASICELYTTDEIFREIEIPEKMDKKILVNTIMDTCMLYQPLYVDMPILNTMIRNFFKKNKQNFDKIWYLFNLKYDDDYNPIWNKDGNFEETEQYENNKNDKIENTNNTNSVTNENTINQVAPFDTENWQNSDKNDNKTIQDIDNKGNQNETHSENYKKTLTRKEKGNIGVTTTAKMINEEFNLQSNNKYNAYEVIALKFYDEFFIHY